MKIGMYVRCPIYDETDEPRTYYLGQVISIDEKNDEVTVFFHDHAKLRVFFASLPEKATYSQKVVVHTPALDNTTVIFNKNRIKLLSVSKAPNKDNENSSYLYYVEYIKQGRPQIGEVSETQIEIPFTRANYNPAKQMMRYELQNPGWFLNRRIVSKSLNLINNAPNGFKNLLGTRVQLFTHQVDTIVRALSEKPCRLMLADEVGLGKTIEALAIIKGMLDKSPNMRSLIILPETLIYQWQTELSYKFWFDVPIWGVNEIKNPQILLISSSALQTDFARVRSLCKWDMCVVDETHKLLGNNALYNNVLLLCKEIENILLLSATPILHREQEYHKLLTLLNPSRFEEMPIIFFNNLLSKQKNIRDIVFSLMKDLSDYISV